MSRFFLALICAAMVFLDADHTRASSGYRYLVAGWYDSGMFAPSGVWTMEVIKTDRGESAAGVTAVDTCNGTTTSGACRLSNVFASNSTACVGSFAATWTWRGQTFRDMAGFHFDKSEKDSFADAIHKTAEIDGRLNSASPFELAPIGAKLTSFHSAIQCH